MLAPRRDTQVHEAQVGVPLLQAVQACTRSTHTTHDDDSCHTHTAHRGALWAQIAPWSRVVGIGLALSYYSQVNCVSLSTFQPSRDRPDPPRCILVLWCLRGRRLHPKHFTPILQAMPRCFAGGITSGLRSGIPKRDSARQSLGKILVQETWKIALRL